MAESVLNGIRVLDFTEYLAGPYVCMYLADMGADVIKIENAEGGNYTRKIRPREEKSGIGMYWHNFNRGKRSLALNLKTEEGREIFTELVKSADVLIENHRPGVMQRLGFDWEHCHEMNPRLIYASISGFGQTGRNAYKPGFDLIAQAMGGAMSITGWPGGEPTRLGIAAGDLMAALNTGIGVCASLYRRSMTGKGNYIDVALLDGIVAGMESMLLTSVYEGRVYGREGNKYTGNAPYDSFAAADGDFVIATGNDRHWVQLCTLIGRPELAHDPRFTTTDARKSNDAEMRAVIEDWARDRTAEECMRILDQGGIPAAPIRNTAQVVADPALWEDRGMFVKVAPPTDHPEAGELTVVGNPIKMPLTPTRCEKAGPELGEHNREILRELGFTGEQIEDFLTKGVINR